MPGVISQKRFIEEALAAHNEYRRIHGVPTLELDSNLSHLALDWAENLASMNKLAYSDGEYQGEPYGANILRFTLNPSKPLYYSGSEATDEWYKQESNYNYDGSFSPNTGNFTQIVWKNTRKVGFGFAISDSGKFYVVANYFPAGNYQNQFNQNVLRPRLNESELKPEIKANIINEFINELTKQANSPKLSPSNRENRSISSNLNDIQSRFIDEALRKHNELRRRHGADPLVHNPELSQIAQSHANTIARKRSLYHSSNRYKNEKLGENLAFFFDSRSDYYSGDKATMQWYDESKIHNYVQDSQPGTGHFTQVVWKSSKEVGFGIAKASDGSFYVAANYYPAGNLIGRYILNVQRPLF